MNITDYGDKRKFSFIRTTPGMQMLRNTFARFDEKSGKYVLNRDQIRDLKADLLFIFKPEDVVVYDDCREICAWTLLNNNRLVIEIP